MGKKQGVSRWSFLLILLVVLAIAVPVGLRAGVGTGGISSINMGGTGANTYITAYIGGVQVGLIKMDNLGDYNKGVLITSQKNPTYLVDSQSVYFYSVANTAGADHLSNGDLNWLNDVYRFAFTGADRRKQDISPVRIRVDQNNRDIAFTDMIDGVVPGHVAELLEGIPREELKSILTCIQNAFSTHWVLNVGNNVIESALGIDVESDDKDDKDRQWETNVFKVIVAFMEYKHGAKSAVHDELVSGNFKTDYVLLLEPLIGVAFKGDGNSEGYYVTTPTKFAEFAGGVSFENRKYLDWDGIGLAAVTASDLLHETKNKSLQGITGFYIDDTTIKKQHPTNGNQSIASKLWYTGPVDDFPRYATEKMMHYGWGAIYITSDSTLAVDKTATYQGVTSLSDDSPRHYALSYGLLGLEVGDASRIALDDSFWKKFKSSDAFRNLSPELQTLATTVILDNLAGGSFLTKENLLSISTGLGMSVRDFYSLVQSSGALPYTQASKLSDVGGVSRDAIASMFRAQEYAVNKFDTPAGGSVKGIVPRVKDTGGKVPPLASESFAECITKLVWGGSYVLTIPPDTYLPYDYFVSYTEQLTGVIGEKLLNGELSFPAESAPTPLLMGEPKGAPRMSAINDYARLALSQGVPEMDAEVLEVFSAGSKSDFIENLSAGLSVEKTVAELGLGVSGGMGGGYASKGIMVSGDKFTSELSLPVLDLLGTDAEWIDGLSGSGMIMQGVDAQLTTLLTKAIPSSALSYDKGAARQESADGFIEVPYSGQVGVSIAIYSASNPVYVTYVTEDENNPDTYRVLSEGYNGQTVSPWSYTKVGVDNDCLQAISWSEGKTYEAVAIGAIPVLDISLLSTDRLQELYDDHISDTYDVMVPVDDLPDGSAYVTVEESEKVVLFIVVEESEPEFTVVKIIQKSDGTEDVIVETLPDGIYYIEDTIEHEGKQYTHTESYVTEEFIVDPPEDTTKPDLDSFPDKEEVDAGEIEVEPPVDVIYIVYEDDSGVVLIYVDDNGNYVGTDVEDMPSNRQYNVQKNKNRGGRTYTRQKSWTTKDRIIDPLDDTTDSHVTAYTPKTEIPGEGVKTIPGDDNFLYIIYGPMPVDVIRVFVNEKDTGGVITYEYVATDVINSISRTYSIPASAVKSGKSFKVIGGAFRPSPIITPLASTNYTHVGSIVSTMSGTVTFPTGSDYLYLLYVNANEPVRSVAQTFKVMQDHLTQFQTMATSTGTVQGKIDIPNVLIDTKASTTSHATYTWDEWGNPVANTRTDTLSSLSMTFSTDFSGLGVGNWLTKQNPIWALMILFEPNSGGTSFEATLSGGQKWEEDSIKPSIPIPLASEKNAWLLLSRGQITTTANPNGDKPTIARWVADTDMRGTRRDAVWLQDFEDKFVPSTHRLPAGTTATSGGFDFTKDSYNAVINTSNSLGFVAGQDMIDPVTVTDLRTQYPNGFIAETYRAGNTPAGSTAEGVSKVLNSHLAVMYGKHTNDVLKFYPEVQMKYDAGADLSTTPPTPNEQSIYVIGEKLRSISATTKAVFRITQYGNLQFKSSVISADSRAKILQSSMASQLAKPTSAPAASTFASVLGTNVVTGYPAATLFRDTNRSLVPVVIGGGDIRVGSADTSKGDFTTYNIFVDNAVNASGAWGNTITEASIQTANDKMYTSFETSLKSSLNGKAYEFYVRNSFKGNLKANVEITKTGTTSTYYSLLYDKDGVLHTKEFINGSFGSELPDDVKVYLSDIKLADALNAVMERGKGTGGWYNEETSVIRVVKTVTTFEFKPLSATDKLGINFGPATPLNKNSFYSLGYKAEILLSKATLNLNLYGISPTTNNTVAKTLTMQTGGISDAWQPTINGGAIDFGFDYNFIIPDVTVNDIKY